MVRGGMVAVGWGLAAAAAVASPVVESVNGSAAPPFLVWGTDKAGWVIVPTRSFLLDGVYSTFRNVGAASQSGPVLERDVTVSVSEGNAGGPLLARGSFRAGAAAGDLGTALAPVLVLAGRPIFVAYAGLNNLGLNIVDWNITAPSPQQPAGTRNLDGWYYGDRYETYVPQVVNGVLQVFSAPILRLQGQEVGFTAQMDCLFAWAETAHGSLFAPAGQASAAFQGYYYRRYPGTRSYVGVSVADRQVHYIDPDGHQVAVGSLAEWLSRAGCPAAP
ncbi:MAG: hypothetical protein U1F56_13375 [Rubrivivax sp.]